MRAAWLLALAVVAALASPVAAGEDDRSLSVGLGYGTYAIPEPDHQPSGAVLGIDYERGFSEELAFRVSALGGVYPLGNDERDDGTRPSTSYSAQLSVGFTYLFDVLKYVPYVHGGLGGVLLLGGPGDGKLNGLVELGGGLEILMSRRFSYGVYARFDSFAQETTVFTAGARATYRWGFF
jgi:hypothetical protein